MAGSPRSMTAPDIAAVEVVEELDVTADGTLAVVVKRVIRRHRQRLVYEGHLWLIDLVAGGRPRQVTSGCVRDTWPRFSPDGSTVAFLRSEPLDEDAPNRLCTIAVHGGTVRNLAPRGRDPGFGAISSVEWSPDSSRLAFTAEAGPPRWLVGEVAPVGSKAERAPKQPAPVARRIGRADWRWDEAGHLDHWSHLFVLAPDASGAARQVTSGDYGVSAITWHPDGRTVAFVSDRSEQADVRPHPAIWAVDVDAAGRPRSKRSQPLSQPGCVLDAGLIAGRPTYSPDGRWLAAVGVLDAEALDDVSPSLLLTRSDGSQPPVALAPELDRPIGNWTDTDLTGWMVSGRVGPMWLDRSTIVAVVTDRGRSLPERWTIDPVSGSLRSAPVVAERSAAGPWAESVTQTVAAGAGSAWSLSTSGGRGLEVSRVDRDAATITPVTRFGTAWQRRFVQPEMTRVEAPGAGGPIETWIASPPDAGDAALPTIIAIHGGPLGGWGPAPHVETIILTGAGYRVVCPNIRGGAGYGAGWIRPQLGDWGGVDAADVHAAVDHVVSLGLADPTRLGAFGLSYGGFMVNWLVGTSDRFAAAVSENGVTNQVSAWAGSDSGPEYCRLALLGDPFTPEGIDRLWRQSPLRHVDNVHTPLLMLQGEADLRCPASDNEQFFIALRHLGRTVDYVLYPGSYHTFAYTGRPDRRIDRMQRVLDWFAQHLHP